MEAVWALSTSCGRERSVWLAMLKRLFLLLPLGGIAFGTGQRAERPVAADPHPRRAYVGLVSSLWTSRAPVHVLGGVFRSCSSSRHAAGFVRC